jgi:hypothetical protein
MPEVFRITVVGNREELIRPADEVVIAMMVRESITSPRRRASGFGWSAETVRTGLIATEVAEDRQKGT